MRLLFFVCQRKSIIYSNNFHKFSILVPFFRSSMNLTFIFSSFFFACFLTLLLFKHKRDSRDFFFFHHTTTAHTIIVLVIVTPSPLSPSHSIFINLGILYVSFFCNQRKSVVEFHQHLSEREKWFCDNINI